MAKKKEEIIEEVVNKEVEEVKVEAKAETNERLAYLYGLLDQLLTEKITRMSDLENKIAQELKK